MPVAARRCRWALEHLLQFCLAWPRPRCCRPAYIRSNLVTALATMENQGCFDRSDASLPFIAHENDRIVDRPNGLKSRTGMRIPLVHDCFFIHGWVLNIFSACDWSTTHRPPIHSTRFLLGFGPGGESSSLRRLSSSLADTAMARAQRLTANAPLETHKKVRILSACGIFETCRQYLKMSAHRGRPEVISARPQLPARVVDWLR